MIFYHGTDNLSQNDIFSKGLNPSFLTTSLEQASYYAETTADINESEPIILEINISSEDHILVTDFRSIEEPLTFIINKHNFRNDEDFHNAFSDETNEIFFHPDKKDWETSLFLTDCVFCETVISPDFIKLWEA